MIFLQLYFSFVKIGFTSFGGLSMVPLIMDEVLSHAWMTVSQVSDIAAIAEMTPGPLGLNCATFAGMQAAGVAGALAASLGILTPSLTVCIVTAIFFEKFRNSKRIDGIMTGVRPACLGMIMGVVISLSAENYFFEFGAANVSSIGIGMLDLILLLQLKITIPWVLGISALLGVVLFGAMGNPI